MIRFPAIGSHFSAPCKSGQAKTNQGCGNVTEAKRWTLGNDANELSYAWVKEDSNGNKTLQVSENVISQGQQHHGESHNDACNSADEDSNEESDEESDRE